MSDEPIITFFTRWSDGGMRRTPQRAFESLQPVSSDPEVLPVVSQVLQWGGACYGVAWTYDVGPPAVHRERGRELSLRFLTM